MKPKKEKRVVWKDHLEKEKRKEQKEKEKVHKLKVKETKFQSIDLNRK